MLTLQTFPSLIIPAVTEQVDVKAEEYMSKLVDQCSLSFLVMAEIQETGQVVTTLQYMTLQAPKLELKVRLIAVLLCILSLHGFSMAQLP